MSAHRDSNEQHAENKDATTLSKEPGTSSGLDWRENNIGEETCNCVGVSSVLEPDTSSGLDRQDSNIDEMNICVGVSSVHEPDTSSGQDLWESSIDEETKICVDDEGDKPSIPPTNYLHISKHEAVNGQFILDLSLPPPPPPPGITSDKNCKNLTLHTTKGPVKAEIWIRHKGSPESKRVSLDLCSNEGPVRAIVHDSFSPNGCRRTLPYLNMEMRSNHGDVYLSLPRCFRGPITIRTRDDRIAFSPAFERCTALVSDVQGVRVYFVGHRPRGGKWGTGDGDETVEDLLDEISVDGRYTSVRINWVGEKGVPFMMIDGWRGFCGGVERFFRTGKILW